MQETIQFVKNGEIIRLDAAPLTRTLLDWLREDARDTTVKEGCASGDCGACAVTVAEPQNDGSLRYRAINSCIRLVHSVSGCAIFAAGDLAQGDTLHPVQQALVEAHASQCGFCTPGFVMALHALHENGATGALTRDSAQEAISGNLCRCTGYRPIVDAALALEQKTAKARARDDAALQALLAKMPMNRASSGQMPENADSMGVFMPRTEIEALQTRAAHPQAQLIAGCTDVGIWINKQHKRYAALLDVTRVAQWQAITRSATHTQIGAAARLTEAFAALVAERPQLAHFAARFAGLTVRNSGTLGGNVANGSPIGDSMPLLIALGATVTLAAWRDQRVTTRTLALEDFYVGYRQTVLAADEVVSAIHVPHAAPNEWMRAYKLSKRFEDDISAVCLGVAIHCEGARITQVRIGVGGVAATPVRARETEALLRGQDWNRATVEAAKRSLQGHFQPIDDMRASARYRQTVLANLLERFWRESQGETNLNLEHGWAA
jgi:xanthine dehydrogenase small subunit